MRWFSAALSFAYLASACASGSRPGERAPAKGGPPGLVAAVATASTPARQVAADAVPVAPTPTCAEILANAGAEPALAGTPEFDAHRAEIFARAKTDGVLLVATPVAVAESADGARLRSAVWGAADPVKALYEAYPTLQKRRDLARDVLLSDGYLYAASPSFAAALVSLTRLEDLFQDAEIWVHRGVELRRAVLRGRDGYVYADGPSTGEHVKLVLLDRVAASRSALAVPLHRDVGELERRLGFDELRVHHMSERSVVADLRYGEDWIPSVLAADGARLTLACEIVPKDGAAKLTLSRAAAARRNAVLDRLRAVMREQVEEALPFDEPKTEIGQQDGKLRQHWAWAYRFGRSEFEFNDDRYKVFDAKGRPRVPQVCIDFVTDTFERTSGSWFRSRGEPRERVPGRLDFTSLGIDNERSVERFVDFARSHPEFFDVMEVPPEERVPYAHRAAFFADLTAHRDRYRPGDVVTIYGLRADGKMHYHSFIVYDADPVSGAPSLVAANAGRPRIRPWESEMTSAPLRSIRARVRPRLEWLESVAGDHELEAKEPAARPRAPDPEAPATTAI